MRKIMTWLLLAAVTMSTMLPVRLLAETVITNVPTVEGTKRQQEIARLQQAIDKIKQNKSLPDEIKADSLKRLLGELSPLLSEEIGYLSGQRDAIIANETDETVKTTLQKSFDKSIQRLKAVQAAYFSKNPTGGSAPADNLVAAVRPKAPKTPKKSTPSAKPTPSSPTDTPDQQAEDPADTPDYPPADAPVQPAATPTPPPTPTPSPVQIRIDDVPEIGDSTVGARVRFIGANAIKLPRLVINVSGSGTQMTLPERALSTTSNDEPVISDPFDAKLKAGNVIKYQVIGKNAANVDTEITTLSVVVFAKVDPTESGLFGLLFAGLVSSRQAQTVNEAAPFMGFQVGWGSKVKGIRNHRPSTDLNFSNGCPTTISTLAGDWDIEFNQLKAPAAPGEVFRAIFERIEDGDFNVNNNPYRLVGSTTVCEVRFQNHIHPFTGGSTSRWSYRFQGLFSNEGRMAFADIPSSETLPAGQVNRRFPFINHRESFSPEFTVWREWNPLGQFSYGFYGTLGATTVLDSNTTDDQFITDPQSLVKVKAKVLSPGGAKFFAEFGSIQHLKFDPGKFLLQNFAGFGYYEAYRGTRFNFGGSCPDPALAPCSPVDSKTRFRFVDKLRVFPEGIAVDFGRQLTMTPMFGVDLNVGAGPDNIRFFTGFAIKLKAFDGKKVEDK